MRVFLRLQGDDCLVDSGPGQLFVQGIKAAEDFLRSELFRRISDEALDMEAQLLLVFQVGLVLLRQGAGTDDHDMFEVVTLLPEAPEYRAHQQVFSGQEKNGDQVENEEENTGEIHQAEEEQQGGSEQGGDGHADENHPDFPDQPPRPGGIVKAKPGEQEEHDHRVGSRQQDRIPAQDSHVFAAAVQEIEPDPGSQHIGKNHQEHIRQDIDTVQECLVFSDHGSSTFLPYRRFPGRIKGRAPPCRTLRVLRYA